MPRIGINLSPVNYWTPVQPFLDRMKTAGNWRVQGTTTTPLTLGPTGLPTNFPAGATVIYAMVGMDTPGATFRLLYSGDAKIQLGFSTVISTAPGEIVFQWNDATPAKGQMQLIIRSGTLTDIKIVRADQADLLRSGEIFKPDYLDLLKGMSHFRVMDWMRVNNSLATDVLLEWDGSYGADKPVPLSVIIALANKTGLRPWINLPAGITDVGIAAAFDYLKAHLRAAVRPIIEPSNEVWNLQFTQAKTATMAVTAKTGNGAYWYGTQLARVAKIARGRYDIGLVGMWQFVVPGRFNDVYAGFKDAGGLDSDIEAIGGADYLTGTLNSPSKPDALNLLAANDVAGALANVSSSLPAIATSHAAWAALAKTHGWKYWTYEGGNYHLNTAFFGTNAEPLRAFYEGMQKSDGAPAVLSTNADNFFAAGGDAMTIYNLSSQSTASGYFGIIETPSWAMYRARLGDPMQDQLRDLRARVQALADELDRLLAA